MVPSLLVLIWWPWVSGAVAALWLCTTLPMLWWVLKHDAFVSVHALFLLMLRTCAQCLGLAVGVTAYLFRSNPARSLALENNPINGDTK